MCETHCCKYTYIIVCVQKMTTHTILLVRNIVFGSFCIYSALVTLWAVILLMTVVNDTDALSMQTKSTKGANTCILESMVDIPLPSLQEDKTVS